jgi:glycosyltransferase involved in cell wall biosynthesis
MSRSLKVVHIITRLILGGAQENTLYNCEDLLREYGDEVLLVTGPAEGPEGDLFERARRNQVPLQVVPELRRAIGPLADGRAAVALRRIIRDFRPDVVHTHSSKAGILGRGAAWREKVPGIIHTIHGLAFHPYERWWKNWMYINAERWAARRCHRIISVADAMTEQALAQRIGRPEQYVTIRSGMEVEPFLESGAHRVETRRKLGIGNDEVVVMKVARLFELKGHDDLIEAAGLLQESGPKVRYVFVGGGVAKERLEAKIQQAGLANQFLFTGLVASSEIPRLIGASDIVVHASYREGLARVLPQALIAARPVVSYDVDGAREVVLPGKTGFLVPPHDWKGLAAAIETLARDADLRDRLGQTGQAMFRDLFRHEMMSRQIRSLYEETLRSSEKEGFE